MTLHPIEPYHRQIEKALQAQNATEHTHRPALKTLVESLAAGITATNEPKREACGAPDFAVSRNAQHGPVTLGYMEAKDVDKPLDEVERDEQIQRYLTHLPNRNFILTDYLEFRWYVEGKHRQTARVARVSKGGKLAREKDGEKAVTELLTAFLSQEPEPTRKPKELALRMARLAHLIRDMIVAAFKNQSASATLQDLHGAFEKALIPDLPEKQFADMFAQTLAYGLFAARCNHQGPAGSFRRLGAAQEIPKTNPFLRQLFETITGTALDEEPFVGFVDDLAQLLADTVIEGPDGVLADFGKRTARQDPVVHFYETFLAAYDPKLREARGVYYTPEPVVSYIVRSVDSLLKTRFGCPNGLADTGRVEYEREEESGGKRKKVQATSHRVLILDPACGTGTFLYAVIDHIRNEFMRQGNAGMWSGYVRNHLLPRIFGFELLMAPYAVAHFKLGMQLAGQDMSEAERETWSCDFAGNERLGVYLTNTLEEAERRAETLFGPLRVITQEAIAAAAIKHDLPIMIIMGNPPYSGISANRSEWITDLIKCYREVNGQPLGEKKVWLKNDYIKFVRFGQWRIESTGSGILAFITDHSYLDSPTFRGMRQHLLKTFGEIYILNLHGNSKRREESPDGTADQNVFDITQGVAIALFVKRPGKQVIHYADLWGLREEKYSTLMELDVSNTRWEKIVPHSPLFQFVPVESTLEPEYAVGWKVNEIFSLGSNGVQTSRDSLVVALDNQSLANSIELFIDENRSIEEIRFEFFGNKAVNNYAPGDTREWKLEEARSALQKTPRWREDIIPYLYRPFDERFVLYSKSMVDWPREKVMRQMRKENRALCVGRAGLVASGTWDIVFLTKQTCDHNLFYRGSSLNFPVYVYPTGKQNYTGQRELRIKKFSWASGPGGRQPNLNPKFVADLEKRVRLSFVPDGKGDLRKTFGPEDVFHYIYAVLHAPTYRRRYAEFLKSDFPRVPLTSDVKLFRRLCGLGSELASLHLLESPKLAKPMARFPVKGANVVEKGYPKYVAPGEPEPGTGKKVAAGRVYISKGDAKAGKEGQYFEGVPPEVWEFHIGGYQVCEKWLKDRRGRELRYEDLEHYCKIVTALAETIRLMGAIDGAIPRWPME